MVRRASVQAGGLVAVARNPVTASYAKEHAAPGAIRMCLQVGQAILEAREDSPAAAAAAAARASGGAVICYGKVTFKELETSGGFDTGRIVIVGESPAGDDRRVDVANGQIELAFCNEYLTLEAAFGSATGGGAGSVVVRAGGSSAGGDAGSVGRSVRLATFPDLIVTMDLRSGMPVSSAEIREGQEFAVVVVPRHRLILGAGVKDPKLYRDVERAVGKDLVSYAFGPSAS